MVSVEAVIETPLLEHPPLWRVASLPAFSWLRLWRGTTQDEIGLVIWYLAKYNLDEFEGKDTRDEILKGLTIEEEITLPGGLRFQNGEGKTVRPGCCCGLEKWRDWQQVVCGDLSPWFGHDPWPWVERIGETFRVWADQSSDVFLDIERNDLIGKLRTVQHDLIDFLCNLEKWVDEIDPKLTRSIIEKFDSSFSIRSDLEL